MKNHTRIQIETRFTREYILVEGTLAENVQNPQFFFNSTSLNCIQYILISRCAVVLMR